VGEIQEEAVRWNDVAYVGQGAPPEDAGAEADRSR
jgi:hypothetical protein